MTTAASLADAPATKGRLIHWALGYDILAWVFLHGRERQFRERIVAMARVSRGERVLDIGCGTGTLAIQARRVVGPTGEVHGVDASGPMVSRARAKARRAGAELVFQTAIVEALPYPDGRFDVVLSTLMMHHLPGPAREACVREALRVLAPGGRMLVVDFAQAHRKQGVLAHFHRHGHVDPQKLVDLLATAGFRIEESGALGVRDLSFVLATKP